MMINISCEMMRMPCIMTEDAGLSAHELGGAMHRRKVLEGRMGRLMARIFRTKKAD